MIEIFLFALVQKDFSSADEDVKAVELHIFLRLKEYPKNPEVMTFLDISEQNIFSFQMIIDLITSKHVK